MYIVIKMVSPGAEHGEGASELMLVWEFLLGNDVPSKNRTKTD